MKSQFVFVQTYTILSKMKALLLKIIILQRMREVK